MNSPLLVALLVWLGSLFALIGVERFVLDPMRSTSTTVVVFLLQVLPILVTIPIVLRRPARGAFWVSLVALLYFTDGVVATFVPGKRLIGAIEIVFALGAFVTALLLMRAHRPDVKAP